MTQADTYTNKKTRDYELLLKQLKALIEDDTDNISLLSNTSALFKQFLKDINWVGFYLWKKDQLVLGPFQGLPACTRIAYGKGVCGTAVKTRKTIRVANVDHFPGHIVCDAASKSEIVLPLIVNGEIYGVLDIDSPITDRFDDIDEKYLERCVEIIKSYL